jgi:hypothetical protein
MIYSCWFVSMQSFSDRFALLREQRGHNHLPVASSNTPNNLPSTCVDSVCIATHPCETFPAGPDDRESPTLIGTGTRAVQAKSSNDDGLIASPSNPYVAIESAESYSGVLSTYSGVDPWTPQQEQEQQQPTGAIGRTETGFEFIPSEFAGRFVLVSECVSQVEPVPARSRCLSPTLEGKPPYWAALLYNACDIFNNSRRKYVWRESQSCCLRSDVVSELRPVGKNDACFAHTHQLL